MRFVDVIVDYIRRSAPLEELKIIENALKEKQGPQIDPDAVKAGLLSWCQREYNGNNKLLAVRHIKEVTGWGLKDAKDYFDNVIEPLCKPEQGYIENLRL